MSMVVTVSAALRVRVVVVVAETAQAFAQAQAELRDCRVLRTARRRGWIDRLALYWLGDDVLPIDGVADPFVVTSCNGGGE
jgi:hypothetical protein